MNSAGPNCLRNIWFESLIQKIKILKNRIEKLRLWRGLQSVDVLSIGPSGENEKPSPITKLKRPMDSKEDGQNPLKELFSSLSDKKQKSYRPFKMVPY